MSRLRKLCLASCMAALLLCGCGAKESGAPAETPAVPGFDRPAGMESVLPGSDRKEPPARAAVPEKEEELSEQTNEAYETAFSLIGEDVQKLYQSIGQPITSDYTTSCLGPGEDGELRYEGFTVYTYKEGQRETVHDVIGEAG